MRRELKDNHGTGAINLNPGHKAYPDEKGTERAHALQLPELFVNVTRHIPMRRELKVVRVESYHEFHIFCHKAYPDEKGTESGKN